MSGVPQFVSQWLSFLPSWMQVVFWYGVVALVLFISVILCMAFLTLIERRVIGSIQATEAIKLMTGEGDTLEGRLLLYDALDMSFQEVKIRWDADCPVCGKEPSITELIDYEAFCGVPARS